MESPTHTIARLIQQADHFISYQAWDDAAGQCYQILALDPSNRAAQIKLAQIYQQPELVEAMQCALTRLALLGEPHASPHHQRRRLAFSYRVLSCWPGWQTEWELAAPVGDLEEAAQIIEHAYLTGEDEDLLTAWELFIHAMQTAPEAADHLQWWMVRHYAAHGFFADAAEILSELLAAQPLNADVRYLLAEMRWWRDVAETLAWA